MARYLMLLVILWATPLWSEIHNCKGVWTSSPCGSIASDNEQPKAKARKAKSSAEVLLSKKKDLIRDFVSATYAARRKYDIDYPVLGVETICLAVETSLVECANLITQSRQKLAQLIQDSMKNKEETPSQTNITTNQQITIIQDNSRPYRRRRNYRVPSRHIEGPFQGYRSRFD